MTWTVAARAQLQGIHDYVAADSVGYARRLVDRLTQRTEQLASFPETGSRVLEYDLPTVRELLEGSYRIIYRIGADRIDVVAVIHSARLLPDAPPES